MFKRSVKVFQCPNLIAVGINISSEDVLSHIKICQNEKWRRHGHRQEKSKEGQKNSLKKIESTTFIWLREFLGPSLITNQLLNRIGASNNIITVFHKTLMRGAFKIKKSDETWEMFPSEDDPLPPYPTWDFFELGIFL